MRQRTRANPECLIVKIQAPQAPNRPTNLHRINQLQPHVFETQKSPDANIGLLARLAVTLSAVVFKRVSRSRFP